MNKIANQDIEKYYFERFRKDYPIPSETIIYGDKPDVIVKGERQIGIEITRFFREKGSLPKCEQRQKELRKKVVSAAQSIYQKENGKNFEISFGFDKANPIQDRHQLASKLANLAKDIEDWETGKIRRDIYSAIPEISFVYLNTNEYEDARWRVVQVYDIPKISRDRLIDIVRGKEERARKYKKCDAYWLLVIVDFWNLAQDQEIRIDGLEKIETEKFEKIIVYKTVFGHVLEVK